MAIEEVTEWATTARANRAIQPTGPQGRDASRTSLNFQEMQAAIARWRDTLGGGSSPLTTKGDLYTYDSADARLPVGADGTMLVANSAQATGLEWVASEIVPAGTVTDAVLRWNGTTWVEDTTFRIDENNGRVTIGTGTVSPRLDIEVNTGGNTILRFTESGSVRASLQYVDFSNDFQIITSQVGSQISLKAEAGGTAIVLENDLLSLGNTSVSGTLYGADAGTNGWIAFPEGGDYSNVSGAQTGAIGIELPTARYGDFDLVSFEVDILTAETEGRMKVRVQGRTGIGGAWTFASATILTSDSGDDYAIRLGRNSANDRDVVWIGELADTWTAMTCRVNNVIVGENANTAEWATGWNVYLEASSFAAVATTLSTNLPAAQAPAGAANAGGNINTVQYHDGGGVLGGLADWTVNDLATTTSLVALSARSGQTSGDVFNIYNNQAGKTEQMLRVRNDNASAVVVPIRIDQDGTDNMIEMYDGLTLAFSIDDEGYIGDYPGTPGDLQVLTWVNANGRAEFAAAPGTIGGSITNDQIAVGAATADDIEGADTFSLVASSQRIPGGIRFTERATHIETPAATFAELWLRNDAPNVLVFTDDAGSDFNISPIEGTFTPTLLGSTTNPTQSYFIQLGNYQRLGNWVHFQLQVVMAISGVSAGSGVATIGGLPITSSSTNVGTFAVYAGSWATTNRGAPSHAEMKASTTVIDLAVYDNDAGNQAGIVTANAADIGNLTAVKVSGCYYVG